MSIYSPVVNGIKYKIYNKEDVIQNGLLNGHQWDEEILNITKSYILEKKLSHFLNIGSHIGSICLPISLCVDKVTAIEAYPETYNHLCENIVVNKLPNITTLNTAVGNSEEDVYFMSKEKICPIENINRVVNNSGGMHVFTENDITNNIRSGILTDRKIKNKINKLDNLEINDFDIMLVDIVGLEYDFLLGAEKKIIQNKPIIIIDIWNNDKRKRENVIETQEEVINYINSLNYTLVKNIGENFIFEPIHYNMNNSSHSENKTIYMTYKKNIPNLVFDRWKLLNKDYSIELSLDDDCIHFLRNNFNNYVADLFLKIPIGMYKADLWRLCKLYIYGGVYADVDLVPYLNIDTLDKDVTFYSCLSIEGTCIFQAFIINHKPKSPLILHFIISFLLNNPYRRKNGPPYDMYECLSYNLNNVKVISEKKYNVKEIKIHVNIGPNETNIKDTNLYFFPEDVDYNVKLIENPSNYEFKFIIKNNILTIERLDKNIGWEEDISVDICIDSEEIFFLFKENIGPNNDLATCYVTLNDVKILDSRDVDYYNNDKSW